MRKRIAAIHDLVSYGGAALMNIIPIMYSSGIEVNPIPTALFTSHGAFKGVKKQSNTEFMKEYMDQWYELKLQFDGIYLGLFTDESQVLSAMKFLQNFADDECLVVVDPILGDNGKAYDFMEVAIIKGVQSLLGKADIITPNLTEACLLTNREYSSNLTEDDINSILLELSAMGPKNIILTSVPKDDNLDIYIYNSSSAFTDIIRVKKLPGFYPGTGDVFTAVVMAELLRGQRLYDSVIIASSFIENGIKIILERSFNPLEGLPLGEMQLFTSHR